MLIDDPRLADPHALDLGDIRDILRKHVLEYPDHGYNCACLDPVIQAVRAALRDGLVTTWEHSGVQNRLVYVFRAALR